MYFNSDSAVFKQSTIWDENGYKAENEIYYVINGLLKDKESLATSKSGIRSNAVGYNIEKIMELVKIYSMTFANTISFKKDHVKANTALDEIAKLEDNWNDNGASSFSVKLIEKCRKIVAQLEAEPFVCPTARGSIQFEYEKENGDYLEFEIYEDRIEVFLDTTRTGEKEFNLEEISATDKMKQMVVDFYG